MVKPHFLLLLLFLFSFSPLRAQKLKTEKLTFDLYSSIVYLSSPQICPEDDLIAFEVSGYDEDQYFSNIWWYSLKDEESRQITHGMTNQNSHPRFSPDGSYLAFLSDRDDFSQIWLLPMDGGEAELAFEFDYEIESFEWSPDGDSLLFLSKVPQHFQYQSEIKEKPPTTELIISILGEDSYWLNNKKLSFEELATQIKTYSPKKFKNKISLRPHQKVAFKLVLKVQELCKKEGFKEILFEALPEKFPKETPKPKAKKEEETKGKKPIVITRLLFKTDDDGYVENEYQQLFTWNLDTDKITQLTSESYEVDRAIFSPKGDQILFESNRTPKADANYNSDLWLISLKEKKQTQLTTDLGYDSNAAWSKDGKWIAYINQPPGIYKTPQCMLIASTGGVPKNLTPQLDRYLEETPVWGPGNNSLFLPIPDHGEMRLIQLSLDGTIKRIVDGGGDIGSFVFSEKENAIFTLFTTHYQPEELYKISLVDNKLTQLSSQNSDLFKNVKLPTTHKVEFKSKDQTLIEAWVHYPPNFDRSKKYPLIMDLHGGPIWHFTGAFDFESHFLAAQGYVVLRPNPRGSYGYGYEFCSAIRADWGNKDYEDVMAAVDHLISLGHVDADRLGVGGWSYGGMLTNYIITKNNRFKAAISGASTTNYTSCYGTDDCFREWEMELGPPWKNLTTYTKLSPIHQVEKIQTPTLIMCGEKDNRCPLNQSEQFYLRLKRLEKEVALVVYPEEGHSISDMGLYQDRMIRWLFWFDKYLLGSKVDPLATKKFTAKSLKARENIKSK